MGKCQVHVKVGGYHYRQNPKAEKEILNGKVGLEAANSAAFAVRSCIDGRGKYGVSTARPGKNRAHALVYTADGISMNDNAKKNTLLRALYRADV